MKSTLLGCKLYGVKAGMNLHNEHNKRKTYAMDIDAQTIVNDLLEQIKQLTFQLAVARATITQLQSQSQSQSQTEKD
jgi:hypothetical protein